ncbi:MAG: hypothetical protein HC892_00070 [Saprospiraceae bacterium]|nr:hypothetical protein [Saprospiraceae bacterium]
MSDDTFTQLFKMVRHVATAPIKTEWAEEVVDEAKYRKLVMPAINYNTNIWLVSNNADAFGEMISDMVKAKQVRF